MVSIIITAYNVEDYIERAIRSACAQTYKDIEIIIVEDCSTDGTRDALTTINDQRVRILYNRTNQGAGASRRRGIEASKGDYILLLDGDDYICENFIESLYIKAVEHNADIVSGGVTIVHRDGSWEATAPGESVVEGIDKIHNFGREKVVFMNNKLIRRSLHEQVPYCTRRYIEDTPVIIPMLALANKVVYTGNAGYHYRMHDKSLTHTSTPIKSALFKALCAEDLITFFEQHNSDTLHELHLGEGYANCIELLKECRPTPESVRPFADEWIEFTTKMIARLGE